MQKLAAKTWYVDVQYFTSDVSNMSNVKCSSDSLQFSSSLLTFQTSIRHNSVRFCRFKMVTELQCSLMQTILYTYFFFKQSKQCFPSLNWYTCWIEPICTFYETIQENAQVMCEWGDALLCKGGWMRATVRWCAPCGSGFNRVDDAALPPPAFTDGAPARVSGDRQVNFKKQNKTKKPGRS